MVDMFHLFLSQETPHRGKWESIHCRGRQMQWAPAWHATPTPGGPLRSWLRSRTNKKTCGRSCSLKDRRLTPKTWERTWWHAASTCPQPTIKVVVPGGSLVKVIKYIWLDCMRIWLSPATDSPKVREITRTQEELHDFQEIIETSALDQLDGIFPLLRDCQRLEETSRRFDSQTRPDVYYTGELNIT